MKNIDQIVPPAGEIVVEDDPYSTLVTLGGQALCVVLDLVDVERLFVRRLSILEIIGMCCVFLLVRGWFIQHNLAIRELLTAINVSALFEYIPPAAVIDPVLAAFQPSEFVVKFDGRGSTQFDILTVLRATRVYDVVEIEFGNSAVRVLRASFSVRKLIVIQNRWSPALDAVRVVFSSLERVDHLIMRHGVLDVVMIAHLERVTFTRLELHDVGFSSTEVNGVADWLARRVHLTELIIIDFPYWVTNTPDVRFFRRLLYQIGHLRSLRRLEFSIGGSFLSLHALKELGHLGELRINVEIHLSRQLTLQLFKILRLLSVASIQIGVYCCRDWSCLNRRQSGAWFLERLREEDFDILYLDGVEDMESYFPN